MKYITCLISSVIIAGCFDSITCPGHPPDHPGHPDHHEPIVDTAITNPDMYYDEHLCEAVMHVDCHTYHLVNDEKICGTDGVTYNTHCDFTKERCRLITDKENYDHITHTSIVILLVKNHGECHPITQAPAVTTTASATMTTTAVKAGVSSTMAAITTLSPVSATSQRASTQAPAVTTTLSTNSIMQNVFCHNVNIVNCNYGFSIVCGSDGRLYPNDCELAKAKCSQPSLLKADVSVCVSTTPGP